ncbi:cobyrinate a,c-diamide synthase [Kiloniella laminariae]|uniref:Cobyrinate a,c-diamide synthase n=1 Tax=Kiloniella laminariae TaxID=454162 RepID=A0ABT4LIF0_9PROT|nr:cobyrinate a,c-diamide synthase [Kiloniella laminariae]MCZ4280710.1 cobyrinate a,c-diamide synthase [Kiloniella laminariae]
MQPSSKGLIIAAPSSGSGKTTLTLALLRHFRNSQERVSPVKTGPDYIDPAYHAAAAGRACYNLDPWALRDESLAALVTLAGQDTDVVLAEGVMGLFDGAVGGAGSTAALAKKTGWPVVLVIDVKGMSASAAAVLHGFSSFDPELDIAGVIFNRVGSPRHASLLDEACRPLGIPVLGHLRRQEDMVLPNRHLGLVQAVEHSELDGFLNRAAEQVAWDVDCRALLDLARPSRLERREMGTLVPPIGQRIAVASDVAFSFCYSSLLEGWRQSGAELTFFSPLEDQQPSPKADAIYLPGGYPELHVGQLGANQNFMGALRAAAEKKITIFGECGGYMVLGQGLIDGRGDHHAMTGLLPVETSFAVRKRSLGYRVVRSLVDSPLGPVGQGFAAHEFHYSTVVRGEGEQPLFNVEDAAGKNLGTAGCRLGSVMGSYIHLIDTLPG